MSDFRIDPDLEIGTIFEVAGGSLKIALNRDIRELTRSHSGRVYDVGQIGSILKIHMGRETAICNGSIAALTVRRRSRGFVCIRDSEHSVSG